jgi:hypothetical protein
MIRRLIPTLPTSRAWSGMYATRWEGFSKAWIRKHPTERGLYQWRPRPIGDDSDGLFGIDDMGDVCGVYVFLARNGYVLYVGKSRNLRTEIKQRYRGFEQFRRRYIHQVTAHKSVNDAGAGKMESDLQWYYTPPWNTRFVH